MTSSKSIFLKDKELTKWWISIVHDDRFDRIKTFTRADIMEQRPSGDQMVGCELALSTLESLVDPEAPSFDVNDADVGLSHNLTHDRQAEAETTDKKNED